MSALRTRGLTKTFPRHKDIKKALAARFSPLRLEREPVAVFEGVDFELGRGECAALLGPNGCGKSTFLRCLAGVMAATSGQIEHGGKTVALLSHGFGNYDELSVWHNILLAQQLFGMPLAKAKEQALTVAAFGGLEDRIFDTVSHLSEGMRAKIALSALAHAEFDVALLDESLNHVDAEFRQKYFDLTRNWIAAGRSLILTSHDERLPAWYATRTFRFENKKLVSR
jgi:ABC-type polysaccharide/polyol phosphate transport system ATPase subunit